MMDSSIFQKVFDELEKYLDLSWEKLIVYLEYGDASYSIDFYIKNSYGYTKCYDLPDIDESELDQSFHKIDEIVSEERKAHEELWSNMTMIVENTGDMHTDFDYTDLSNCSYQYYKEWKKKYLV